MQSGESSGSWIGNLGTKSLTNFTITLARESLLGLVSNLTSNAINKLERKISGKTSVWEQEKHLLYLFRIKTWMIYSIHRLIRRFRCINWWSYRSSKTWNKKKRFLADLLAPLATSLMQPVIGAGRGYMNKYF